MAAIKAGGYLAHLRPDAYADGVALRIEIDHLVGTADAVRVVATPEQHGSGVYYHRDGSTVVVGMPLCGTAVRVIGTAEFWFGHKSEMIAKEWLARMAEALSMVSSGYATCFNP